MKVTKTIILKIIFGMKFFEGPIRRLESFRIICLLIKIVCLNFISKPLMFINFLLASTLYKALMLACLPTQHLP